MPSRAASSAAATSAEAPPYGAGSARQLLFDDLLIEQRDGFAPHVPPPLAVEGPLIVPDRPWEHHAIYPGPNVVQPSAAAAAAATSEPSLAAEAERLELWYPSADEAFRFHLCYAESTDGRHWTKPDCGVVEYRGSKANNIVYDGHGEVYGPVFLDPTAPPPRRYKGVFPGPTRIAPGAPALSGAYSPDGIHWTWCGKDRIVEWYYDTHSSAFWDPALGKYVLYARENVGWTHRGAPYYRAINRTESADFENFPAPRRVLESGRPDRSDGQLYNPGVIRYPWADRAYFAFPSAFYRQDMLDIQLYTSRDGVSFRLAQEAPFVRVGQAGRFDAMMIFMGGGCVRRGAEVWLYYGGFPGGHTALPAALEQAPEPRWGGIGLVRLRLDGFVAQRAAAAAGGTLTTRPLRLSGRRLAVNLDASAAGWLKVELLDAAGAPLAGYSRHEADPLHGNDVHKIVTWSGRHELPPPAGAPLRLCFIGEAVDLYAFQAVGEA